jgi:D-3-phosphoglycerate dehydrogenase
MARVLVAGIIHQEAEALLAGRDDVDYEIVPAATAAQIDERIADVDGVVLRVTPFGAKTLARAPRLVVVSRFGVGYDSVDVEALTARRIPLTIVGDANAVPVAEHALAMMLAVSRHMIAVDRGVRTANWDVRYHLNMTELALKRVLVVGFGRIGKHVARRCHAFDMEVVVADPYVAAADVEAAGYAHMADFRDGLGTADYVTLHLPAAADGTPVMGRAEIDAMKAGAILINVARGTLVDEGALAEALAAGRLAGAGVDVFREEPVRPNCPLIGCDSVVLSAHNAALTEECIRRMSLVAVQNVLDALDGRLDAAMVVNREVLDEG